MTKPLELSRADARRIAVRAQLLDRQRPTDLLDVVRRLTAAAGRPDRRRRAERRPGAVEPARPVVRPGRPRRRDRRPAPGRPARAAAAGRGHRAVSAPRWPPGRDRRRLRDWQEDTARLGRGQRRLPPGHPRAAARGRPAAGPRRCPTPARCPGARRVEQRQQRPACCWIHGRSAARWPPPAGDGRERLWDLAERVYPDDPCPPWTRPAPIRDQRRLRVARASPAAAARQGPVEPDDVGDVGEPAVVEGVRGDVASRPGAARTSRSAGRAALLSPLDRLVFDRKRMVELFEFDYQLEMYKPAAKRRWGYWALPILYGDRLVGQARRHRRPRGRRAAGRRGARGRAVHQADAAAVDREIKGARQWLGLELDRQPDRHERRAGRPAELWRPIASSFVLHRGRGRHLSPVVDREGSAGATASADRSEGRPSVEDIAAQIRAELDEPGQGSLRWSGRTPPTSSGIAG